MRKITNNISIKQKPDVWKPKIMSFEITQKCDNPKLCRVCAADATHHAESRLTKDQVITRLIEAKEAGITFFSVTGGEPTLEEDTLFSAIEFGEKIGVRFNYFNTNCYKWGENIQIVMEKLSRIKNLKQKTWNQDNAIICISLSDEHSGVPISRIANFIEGYIKVFPNTILQAAGLRFKKKDDTIEALISELKSRNLLKKIQNNVVRDFGDNEKVTEIFLIEGVTISIFYNYVVPINRASYVPAEEYDLHRLTEKSFQKPVSRVNTQFGDLQAIIIGWDNKVAPDIVFKCTDTLVIQDSDKKSLLQIIHDGNTDPLLRAAVHKVGDVVNAAKKCGYDDIIEELIKKHSTRHGFISELISDPQRKEEIKNYLIKQDS